MKKLTMKVDPMLPYRSILTLEVLPLRRWRLGVRLNLGFEPNDSVDVEQLIPAPT
jgi:hypothetical protein